MRNTLLISWSAWLILLAAAAANGQEKKLDPAGVELFEKHIRPVLVEKCYSCHSKSAEMLEGGLELDSSMGLIRGGESGPIVDLENVDSSLLLRMLRHEEDVEKMPPEEKLDDEVIRAFEKWVSMGLPDPRDKSAPTTKELQEEERLQHWAFLPPKITPPPTVKNADWPRSAIDSFILAKIEAKGLQPVADASRATLVRRLYFDLIGLPPSPQQVKLFVEDPAPDAVAKLVDHLLASPRYGERWGRHWLDVVRYAESSGREFNFTYPHAWPYRDYVVDAFNADKSYDRFVCEQIAGDLLPDEPYGSAEDREARLVATSMLSFGTKRHNSGGMAYRMEIVDDQIDVTCRAILGITVACAKCHDHKFDPIPTKDYYALAGIFLSTEPLYGTIRQKYSNNPTELIPIGPNAAEMHAAAEEYEKIIDGVKKPWDAKKAELTKAEEAKKAAEKKKTDAEKAVAEAKEGDAAPAEALKKVVAELAAANSQIAKFKAEATPLEAAVKELEKSRPPRPPYAMSARDRANPADTKVAVRGDINQPGDVAPRGFLVAFSTPDVPAIDPKQSGRLQLAKWMTSQHNPLPARVVVNRIWHHLFGRGIVESVDNFGLMGTMPSHPKLLDTLAVEFMQDGWSIKRTIRKIVLSRTYQLSCATNEKNQNVDPENRLLWCATPRRLPVEIIRDAILAVSGQLDIKPPTGSPVTALGDQMVRGIDVKKLQPPSNHRSIYLPVVRDYAPDMFDRFDFPSSSLVSGKRAVTNVPSQALFLRNSEFVTQQANHAARRLLADKAAADDAARVDLAMRWAFSRAPTDEERQDALKLLEPILKAKAEIKDRDASAWATLFQSLFATAEFRYLVDIKSP
ncbi:MAG: DUF1553 domain-containing protein [Planctomycetes bacterium]|nr:DUF1553 domain-containing protein [Planctomycetota bacterium]